MVVRAFHRKFHWLVDSAIEFPVIPVEIFVFWIRRLSFMRDPTFALECDVLPDLIRAHVLASS